MRRHLKLIPLAALLLGGCSGLTTSNPDDVTILVPGPVDPSASAKAHLVNNSENAIQVGWLPCYLSTDRRAGDRWVEISRESDACILPVFTIEPGGSMAFPFAAPAVAGTFRVRTVIGGDSVFSAPFNVR